MTAFLLLEGKKITCSSSQGSRLRGDEAAFRGMNDADGRRLLAPSHPAQLDSWESSCLALAGQEQAAHPALTAATLDRRPRRNPPGPAHAAHL